MADGVIETIAIGFKEAEHRRGREAEERRGKRRLQKLPFIPPIFSAPHPPIFLFPPAFPAGPHNYWVTSCSCDSCFNADP